MISTTNLKKSFAAVQAIRDVSFAAQDGAITTLLGANGSGKSTSLRAISGLLALDAGEVHVDGLSVAADPLQTRRRLGVFPDQFGLYPRLTAGEHLEYFAGFHGLRGAALKQAVARVSELLEMDDLLARRTEGFSQGQRMKVALARTLIHRPSNLILDEPSRGLDVMNIRLLRRVLKQLRSEGCCVLLSSHVMAEVEDMSDHVVVLAAGQVANSGSPSELIDQTNTANLEDAFIQLVSRQAA